MQAREGEGASERVLEAASRLFSQKGFSNVSIRDICRESGTTPPVVYYHFRSKKGLFEAVAKSAISMGDFISKLATAAEAGDPREGLQAFVQTYLASFPERSFEPGLYMRDSAALDKTSAKMVSEDLDRIRSLATGLVERGMSEGVYRRASPEMAADCLLGMLNRAIFQHIHFSRVADRERYGKFVADFFQRAMG